MANYNDCQLVTDEMGRHCIVAVTNRRPDGQAGSCYTLHAPDGQVVGGGSSQGTSGTGMGSDLAAMRNGRAAAERWLARQPLHAPGTVNHRLRRKTDPIPAGAVGAQAAQGMQNRSLVPARSQPNNTPALPASSVNQSLGLHDQVAQLYNALCKSLMPIGPSATWTQARVWLLENHCNAQPDLRFWRDMFTRIQSSDFLCGRTPHKPKPGEQADMKPWMANFDWILRTDKMHAILQGRYDNRGHH